MSSRRKAIAGLIAALIVLLALTQRPALQLAAALATCLLVPGLGWARKLRTGDRGDTFALALVISICSTVAVGTTMAVAGRWSVAAGLGALAAITVAGFVPYRRLAVRAGDALPAPVPVNGERVAWSDWYDDARRRAAEQREAERLAALEASARWREWYARRHTEVEPAAVWDHVVPEPMPSEPEPSPEPEMVPETAPAPVVLVPRRPKPEPELDLSGVGPAWTDWYAVARDRDDRAHRDEQHTGRGNDAWREWYRRASADIGS